jgi:hypothetical protein
MLRSLWGILVPEIRLFRRMGVGVSAIREAPMHAIGFLIPSAVLRAPPSLRLSNQRWPAVAGIRGLTECPVLRIRRLLCRVS